MQADLPVRDLPSPSLSTPAIALMILPMVVVIGELIIRRTAGAAILPGLGATLAALALGQIMPLVVFESLLAAKVYSLSGVYEFDGAQLSVKYLLVPQRDVQSIERLRATSIFLFVGCLLIWMAAVSFSARLDPGQTFSITATLLGVLNCTLVWLFFVKF